MLVVIIPSEVKYTTNATMYITGGNMGGPPDEKSEDIVLAASLAMGIGTVTGALFQIPNEHVIFASDPLQKSRTEDSMVRIFHRLYLRFFIVDVFTSTYRYACTPVCSSVYSHSSYTYRLPIPGTTTSTTHLNPSGSTISPW